MIDSIQAGMDYYAREDIPEDGLTEAEQIADFLTDAGYRDVSRVLTILENVIDAHKGEIGTHYGGCYRFHAGCLAVTILHALGHGSDEQE